MSKVISKYRSFKKINKSDLRRLAEIAEKDRLDFFNKYPQWKNAFQNRVICIALCQGAAQHYVDNKTGINDFDVYTFYKINSNKKWYAKRIKSYDYNNAKFGQSLDKPQFIGRRVDCLSREIEIKKNESLIAALRRYLKNSETKTANLLSRKSVILLKPKCGYVVWRNDAV